MYETSSEDETPWTNTSDDWSDQDSWSEQDSWHLDKECDKEIGKMNQTLITDYFKTIPKEPQNKNNN